MSRQVTITLPDDDYEILLRIAVEKHKTIYEIVQEEIQSSLIGEKSDARTESDRSNGSFN